MGSSAVEALSRQRPRERLRLGRFAERVVVLDAHAKGETLATETVTVGPGLVSESPLARDGDPRRAGRRVGDASLRLQRRACDLPHGAPPVDGPGQRPRGRAVAGGLPRAGRRAAEPPSSCIAPCGGWAPRCRSRTRPARHRSAHGRGKTGSRKDCSRDGATSSITSSSSSSSIRPRSTSKAPAVRPSGRIGIPRIIVPTCARGWSASSSIWTGGSGRCRGRRVVRAPHAQLRSVGLRGVGRRPSYRPLGQRAPVSLSSPNTPGAMRSWTCVCPRASPPPRPLGGASPGKPSPEAGGNGASGTAVQRVMLARPTVCDCGGRRAHSTGPRDETPRRRVLAGARSV